MTQALRAEWQDHGVNICGIYPIAVDTTTSSELQGPKQSPLDLAGEVVATSLCGGEKLFPGDAAAYADWLRNPKGM